MKGIDVFCVSQASTAICLSMDEASSSSASLSLSSSIVQHGGRAIDRHNPIIRDGRRAAPCSSQPPINPKSYHQLQKTRKSSKPNSTTTTSSKQIDQKRKSGTNSQAKLADNAKTGDPHHVIGRKSWASKKAADSITPPGSSRYLLGDTASLDEQTDYHDPVLALVPEGNKKNELAAGNQHVSALSIAKDSSSSSHRPKPPSNQVVVLRVSLHCKGCEGKVRKHLSRMEGVTSFNIDFAAKKVTVEGDVTPVSVLASISKVKKAQIWPSGVPPSPNLTSQETKKQ